MYSIKKMKGYKYLTLKHNFSLTNNKDNKDKMFSSYSGDLSQLRSQSGSKSRLFTLKAK